MNLLNIMWLHIIVQKIYKQEQASGQRIERKLVSPLMGTDHEGFCGDWSWRHIRDIWPEKITPGGVSQQDSIHN